MKNFTVAILFCMLMALGAFGHQGSMQQPAQTPQTPGAAEQNPQRPGATPPSVSPQSQPGTVQSPEAQTPQTEPSQAPAMHSGTPGVDEQVSALTAALNLTPDQQAKVKTILEDQHQQAVGVVNDSSLPRDAKLQKKNDRAHQSEQPQPQPQPQNNTPAPK
ncbi:MAG TPA: hypothetical protein VNX88_14670 [Terriglobales bacterium]|jgi:hypothetical protein|nr:hypothetical protein [Terriglobales bacterium]